MSRSRHSDAITAEERHPPAGGGGVLQPYQRGAPVLLARRVSQILLSRVAEVSPLNSARNSFGALVAISQTPGLDQKRLAALMALDATTIGQLVDSLESRGLVGRVASPTDRRVNLLVLTADGRKMVALYRPKALEAQQAALACLTVEERRMFLDFMARIIEANPEHDRPGGGRRSPKSSPG